MNDHAIPGDWVARANCRGETDAMTMPSHRGRNAGLLNRKHVAHARQLCAACPVLEECKAWACTKPDPAYGLIAGGLTPAERGTSGELGRRRGAGAPRVQRAAVVQLGPRPVLTTPGVEHGRRYWYAKGCRCEACTLAAVEYSRRWREKRKATALGARTWARLLSDV